MTIEIVDFPMNHGDFPVRYVSHNQRVLVLYVKIAVAFQTCHRSPRSPEIRSQIFLEDLSTGEMPEYMSEYMSGW